MARYIQFPYRQILEKYNGFRELKKRVRDIAVDRLKITEQEEFELLKDEATVTIREDRYDARDASEIILFVKRKREKRVDHIYELLTEKSKYKPLERLAGLQIYYQGNTVEILDAKEATFNVSKILDKIGFIVRQNMKQHCDKGAIDRLIKYLSRRNYW